ncbi:unnamed protein product, partial [Polarella glacialis]
MPKPSKQPTHGGQGHLVLAPRDKVATSKQATRKREQQMIFHARDRAKGSNLCVTARDEALKPQLYQRMKELQFLAHDMLHEEVLLELTRFRQEFGHGCIMTQPQVADSQVVEPHLDGTTILQAGTVTTIRRSLRRQQTPAELAFQGRVAARAALELGVRTVPEDDEPARGSSQAGALPGAAC